jgi:hypothetical protein
MRAFLAIAATLTMAMCVAQPALAAGPTIGVTLAPNPPSPIVCPGAIPFSGTITATGFPANGLRQVQYRWSTDSANVVHTLTFGPNDPTTQTVSVKANFNGNVLVAETLSIVSTGQKATAQYQVNCPIVPAPEQCVSYDSTGATVKTIPPYNATWMVVLADGTSIGGKFIAGSLAARALLVVKANTQHCIIGGTQTQTAMEYWK